MRTLNIKRGVTRANAVLVGLKSRVEMQPTSSGLNWIVQCFTSSPTQYRLYGVQFLQVKRPNQQYQSTEGES